MNRVIKFRAWDKTNKKMVMPGDYVGNNELMITSSGNITVEYNNHACGDDECCGPNENFLLEKNNQYVLMQFTGLLDRDSDEIYEGDIVVEESEFSKNALETCNKHIVEYKTHYSEKLIAGFSFDSWSWCVPPERLVVIGNVYEPPELLK